MLNFWKFHYQFRIPSLYYLHNYFLSIFAKRRNKIKEQKNDVSYSLRQNRIFCWSPSKTIRRRKSRRKHVFGWSSRSEKATVFRKAAIFWPRIFTFLRVGSNLAWVSKNNTWKMRDEKDYTLSEKACWSAFWSKKKSKFPEQLFGQRSVNEACPIQIQIIGHFTWIWTVLLCIFKNGFQPTKMPPKVSMVKTQTHSWRNSWSRM